MGTSKEKSCKAVVYQKNTDNHYVVLFIRGDLDVNETKLTNFLGCEIHPAVIDEDCGLHAGYIGPYGLQEDLTVLFDRSLQGANNLSCGGNREAYHYTGLDMQREFPSAVYNDFAKIQENGICPHCQKEDIHIFRGIEVGNIFQLGDKYTRSMQMTYLDQERGNTSSGDGLLRHRGRPAGRIGMRGASRRSRAHLAHFHRPLAGTFVRCPRR